MTDQRIPSSREPVSERTPRPLAGTVLAFDLEPEVEALKREDAWLAHGHNARTLIKHDDFRVVLIALRQGARVRGNQTYHQIMVQVLAGRLSIHVPVSAVQLPSGHLLALDRMVPHDVEALEDSAFLLTVGWSED